MIFSTKFERAKREWNREVDEEAARQVEQGVHPFEAIPKAVKIVSERRRRAAQSTERGEHE